jgi:hypothetical protein
MHAPRDVHWNLVKHILCYLRGTLNQGLTISASSTNQVTAYSDADWAGGSDTRRLLTMNFRQPRVLVIHWFRL